jgi:catechol 2,3-dioxygenase-like lactoylglutathione lyase family enzyme
LRFQGIIWAGLLVEDLAGAVLFYRDVLGLRLLADDEGGALFDAGGGALFELWPAGRASSSPKTPDQQSLRIALRVEDLDAAVAELRGLGVEFFGGVGEYQGQRWINFADPEGNRLELKEVPPDGDPARPGGVDTSATLKG